MLTPLPSANAEEPLQALSDAIIEAANAAGIGLIVTAVEDERRPPLYVSEAAARVLGHPVEALMTVPILRLIAPDERPRIETLFERARRHERAPARFETAICTEDGRRVPIEVSVTDTLLAGERIAVTFLTDISERKAAEAAIARSEALFRKLIDIAPEAIWILDQRGLCFVNDAAASMFGCVKEEVLGRPASDFVHPDELEVQVARQRLLLERRERVPPHDFRVRGSSDGAWIHIEVSSMAIDFEGRAAILCFGRDMTDVKQVESQLLQGDRLAALGTLAGGMAHAINNPLTYVLLNLDDLSEQLPKLAEERSFRDEAVQRLKEAHEGAERVAHVVRQMRAFARSDSTALGPLDVRSVLDSSLALVGNELRHRGNLRTEYEDVPLVMAAQARLEQALLNLLLHVARALPDGASSLPEVRLAIRRAGASSVVVEVGYADDAAGEPHEEPFDPTAARRSLDASLAICHGIVTSCGGEMRVAREPGIGTTFRVVLPVAETGSTHAMTHVPASGSGAPLASRARVLVIDDDPGVGKALRWMLEDEHDVTALTSPRQALALLASDPGFDIVFCDLMMAELSGLELYRELASVRPGYEQRVVFMTGGGFGPDELRDEAQITSTLIEKPFDLKRIQSLARGAIGRGGARR